MPIQGLVKWFDPKKGYGFLVGPEGQDVFVHYSQILGDGFRTLADGESVDYELITGDKGFQAHNVMAAPKEPGSDAPKPSPKRSPVAINQVVDNEAEAQRQHARAAAAAEREQGTSPADVLRSNLRP